MIERFYPEKRQSSLILGARGVGKSTFVRNQLNPDLEIDLLHTMTKRKLSLNPSHLEELVAHLEAGSKVFIDEIQKIPELLDEVHRLVEKRKILFTLTGSSARKLKKSGTNLLAGRAIGQRMYPLSLGELKCKDISRSMTYGTLPSVHSSDIDAEEYLFSYVDYYLKEEIFQEGIVRNLNDFSQFAAIAGQYHGQILNYENIGRELGKSGDTINSWFQILEDTLVGYRIPAYPAKVFSKENKHPKFYFFDSGVAWAATGQSFSEIPQEYKGYQLEALILNELKTYLECRRKKVEIFFYSVQQSGDIDFILRTRKKSFNQTEKIITIEIKATSTWKSEFEKMSMSLKEKASKKVEKCIAVYLGKNRLTKNILEVYPLKSFVDLLWSDKIL